METMPTGAVTEILHGLFAIADEEGLARALDSLSPDITWTQYDIDSRPASPMVATGRDEVEALLRKGMDPEMTHRLVRVMTCDDGAACHVECTYPGGAKVECTYLMTLAGSQVTEVLGTMSWDG
ncbi:MAG: nuclear transport factor 2 family protein [Miltoncostaeaceae bacterium]